MTWRVSWQDYRQWRTRDLEEWRPEVVWRDFEDRAQAERELRVQRQGGMTVCMHWWVSPTKRTRQSKQAKELVARAFL